MTPTSHSLVFGSSEQLVSISLLPKFLIDPEHVNVEPSPVARTVKTTNDPVRRITQQERKLFVTSVTSTQTVKADEIVANNFKVARIGILFKSDAKGFAAHCILLLSSCAIVQPFFERTWHNFYLD